MNAQSEAQQYPIAPDERCLWCGSADLVFVGMDTDGWWVGMECAELHCNSCDNNFAVGCHETAEWMAAHADDSAREAK